MTQMVDKRINSAHQKEKKKERPERNRGGDENGPRSQR